MGLTRRDVFKLGGLAAVGAGLVALPLGQMVNGATASLLPAAKMPKPYQATFGRLGVLTPVSRGFDDQGPIDYYDVTAMQGLAGIVPGMSTPVLGYGGLVPARRIDVEQGTRIEMTMHNKLPSAHPTFNTPMDISTHLHGSASLPQYDGYASDVTAPGQKKLYRYPNFEAARTLWYHDHGVHYTAQCFVQYSDYSRGQSTCDPLSPGPITRTSLRPVLAGSVVNNPHRTPIRAWPPNITCTTRKSGHCCRRANSTLHSRCRT